MTEDNNTPNSPFQRLAIATGVVIIIILTIAVAVILAQQSPQETGGLEITPVPNVTASLTPTLQPLGETATSILTSTTTTTTPIPTSLPSLTPTSTFSPEITPFPTTTPDSFSQNPTVVPSTPTSFPRPPTPTPIPTIPGCETAPPEGWILYTVQSGDTIRNLAERTNSSIVVIQEVNCINQLPPLRETIYLPSMPSPLPARETPETTPTNNPTPTRTPTPIIPAIDVVSPNRIDVETIAQQEVTITVTGRNFRPMEADFTIELSGPQNISLSLHSDAPRSETSFQAIVPAGLAEGVYDLVVTNPQTGRTGIEKRAFTVGSLSSPTPTPTSVPLPIISDVTPGTGNINTDETFIIQGENFQVDSNDFKVEFISRSDGTKIRFENFDEISPNRIEFTIQAGTLEAGFYDLVVTNPDGQFDKLEEAYEAVGEE